MAVYPLYLYLITYPGCGVARIEWWSALVASWVYRAPSWGPGQGHLLSCVVVRASCWDPYSCLWIPWVVLASSPREGPGTAATPWS